MRVIARILETLLMLVDPESGHRLIDSQKPKRQPMSDKRFEQMEELVFMVLAMLIPISMIITFAIVVCVTGK